MSKPRKICDNCRGGNHGECQTPIILSTTQEGRIRKSNVICCDDALSWVEQNPI